MRRPRLTPRLRCMRLSRFAPFYLGMSSSKCVPDLVSNSPLNRTINNKLGSRLTLQIGTAGYSLYIGSYLYVSELGHKCQVF